MHAFVAIGKPLVTTGRKATGRGGNREGFWAFKYAGKHVEGFGKFGLETQRIVGADVYGGTWDGTYEYEADGNFFHLELSVNNPAGAVNVVSGPVGPDGRVEVLKLDLPNDFEDQEILLDTYLCTFKVYCKKIRDWAD